MAFPVYIPIGPWQVHPHLLFDLLAYAVGFQIWRIMRRRPRNEFPKLPIEQTAALMAGAIFGAAVGAKLLAWIEDWPLYAQALTTFGGWIGGKTIVGGLLGGWLGIEIAKRGIGLRQSTGDTFVWPLIIGICLGRVGCFLSGMDDKTHGVATALPWGVNFGDGVARHPTQLYEIAWLLVLALIITARNREGRTNAPGLRFRGLMLGYFAFRFAVEFIKPVHAPYLGLSAIQIASLAGMIWATAGLLRPLNEPRTVPWEADHA